MPAPFLPQFTVPAAAQHRRPSCHLRSLLATTGLCEEAGSLKRCRPVAHPDRPSRNLRRWRLRPRETPSLTFASTTPTHGRCIPTSFRTRSVSHQINFPSGPWVLQTQPFVRLHIRGSGFLGTRRTWLYRMVSLTRIPGIHTDDPVDLATNWSARNNNTRVAFICAANEKRPGGDWETGVVGYEERLCRRSTLSATIATPGPTSYVTGGHYPLPWAGGIYSDRVGKSKAPFSRLRRPNAEFVAPFS